MKEQATHIRLIIDSSGKPVEAQYDISIDEHIVNFREFHSWAQANRIPVAGDWPDREVYAIDEVEPVEEWRKEGETDWKSLPENAIRYDSGVEYRQALRLKAKQEEQPKQEAKTAEEELLLAGIRHILDSGVNEIRLFELVKRFNNRAKQQYQQEIIEKLNKAGEWRAVEIINDTGKEPNKLTYCPCCSEKHDFTPDKPTFCKHCSKDHYED